VRKNILDQERDHAHVKNSQKAGEKKNGTMGGKQETGNGQGYRAFLGKGRVNTKIVQEKEGRARTIERHATSKRGQRHRREQGKTKKRKRPKCCREEGKRA